MTYLHRADYLVRHHEVNKELMELGFGCRVTKSELWEGVVVGEAYEQVAYLNYDKMQVYLAPAEQFVILGKPPQLQHYLRVLADLHNFRDITFRIEDDVWEVNLRKNVDGIEFEYLKFNLTTGAPATEADAKAFLELLGEEVSE